MNELKTGDRVIVEFEGKVIYDTQGHVGFWIDNCVKGIRDTCPILVPYDKVNKITNDGSDVEIGDRVSVKFEGFLGRKPKHEQGFYIKTSEASANQGAPFALNCQIKPWELELPATLGTIVQVDPLDEHGERNVYTLDQIDDYLYVGWRKTGASHKLYTTEEVVEESLNYGYRVIPALEKVN